jgi:uncharacterized protein (TIGR02453 family)
MAKVQPYFTPQTFKFLRELARNNNREWFIANKARYEQDLRQPCLRFIAELDAPLKQISAQYVANPKPVGGSLFRIHRDARFSADKSPYKTHSGMRFYHAATRATVRSDSGGNAAMGQLDAPVFYLHLQPGECFLGGGIWHPQPDAVQRIRNYMLNNPASWKKITRSPAFSKQFELGGESLSRPPRGFDPAHELIGDLKRKDFIASNSFDDNLACDPGFQRYVIDRYRQLAPMVDWLCGALDLEF